MLFADGYIPVGRVAEGAHETRWGTVAGACEVGERAADAALKRLKTN
jgi:hypothetical protein